MKLLAHQSEDFESSIVTVHEALRLRRQYPEEWEGSLFFDIIRLRPMVPVDRGARSSSFAFLGGAGGGHSLGSKGIAHELVQEYVCKLRTWPVRVFGKEFLLRIESAADEWRVQDPKTGSTYFVDCRLALAPDSDLYQETGGTLCVEVRDTNKTSHRKQKALARAGQVVMELQMIPDWHIPNELEATSEELRFLRARIRGLLHKGTRLSCLCKPPRVRI